ncbi:hypothetical protein APLC1_2746 [Limnospira platensis C1]|nr:hypothetical protein APLC1_2746 [Arthrospira platensis C1]
MKCNAPLTIQMLMKCQHHSYSPLLMKCQHHSYSQLAVGYATLTHPTKE